MTRRRAARGNRIGLALTGLVLLLAGAAVVTPAGLYGGAATTPLYSAAAWRFIHGHAWIWPAAAAAAIVIGLACLRWLLVQPRRDLLRRLRLDSDRGSEPGAGRTVLLTAAVGDAIEADLTAQPGVRRASCLLSGRPDQPELWLTVTAAAGADLARLCRHLTGELLPSLRSTLGQPGLPARLRITVTRPPRAGRAARPSDMPTTRRTS